ncbi:MAG: ketoacyl-ACP synthase III [Firmicutes bacterium]|nr:ketoacyl-ACP synthase III [Bacillota bacterium]
MRGAGIIGTGSYIPEKVLTNHDLEKMVDTSDEWIFTRTGIRERRLAADHETTAHLGTLAAEAALADAGLDPEQIGLVILCSITPDAPFPATACVVQAAIGATKAGAFDLSAGCSGFSYGLAVGAQFVETGMYDYVLVIGAEKISRITDWTDRTTCVLFGDGAGAAVIGPVPEGYGFLANSLGSDGQGARFLELSKQTNCIRMDGRDVFKFAVHVMSEIPAELLADAGLKEEDVDLFIPHQANIRIIDAAARRLSLPREKVYVNVDRYGNTSAASIGIALDEAAKGGLLKDGDILLTVGFGAGLTWAGNVIKWWGGRG